MGSVGLLYVGAVLFINGAMLLGWIESRSAAPMNVFVGILQVVTPTYLIFTADGDANQILGASGLYLFGFTYLYVAFNLFFGLDGSGLGFFSAFVAVCAVVFSWINFTRFDDNAFGVIWLMWAFLWALFFLLLGRGRANLGRYTGAVAAVQGWVTGAVPAFLLLTDNFASRENLIAVVLAVGSVALFGGLYVLAPQLHQTPDPSAPEPGARPAPAGA